MKTFGEFFGPYIELSRYPESMHHGELTGLQIDTRNRVLTAKVAFPALVDRNTLFHAEKEIASCKTLQLHRAVLDPQFPQECFTVEYYPNLVQELKRRDASINGTLNQSSARLEGDKLIVTLSHGGGNLLLSRHADRLLSDIIREELGFQCRWSSTARSRWTATVWSISKSRKAGGDPAAGSGGTGNRGIRTEHGKKRFAKEAKEVHQRPHAGNHAANRLAGHRKGALWPPRESEAGSNQPYHAGHRQREHAI